MSTNEAGVEKWELKCHLAVANFDCRPEEISHILGVSADETCRKGEKIYPQYIIRHREDVWVLKHRPHDSNEGLAHMVASLLDRIPNLEAFDKLPVGVKVEVGCVIFVHSDEWPYLGLSADVIQCLAKINAALDYDIYPPDIYPPSSDDK